MGRNLCGPAPGCKERNGLAWVGHRFVQNETNLHGSAPSMARRALVAASRTLNQSSFKRRRKAGTDSLAPAPNWPSVRAALPRVRSFGFSNAAIRKGTTSPVFGTRAGNQFIAFQLWLGAPNLSN